MSHLKPATNYTSCCLREPVKLLASAESLNDIQPKTIPGFFRECCEKYKTFTALAYKPDNPGHNSNNWTHITYNDYFENVEKAALALLHLGVEARSSVAILAANCPEWFYIELAALRINAVVAGIYTTNSAEAVYHVLDTSDASVVVVDNGQQMQKIRAIRSRLPKLKAIVQLSAPYDFEETDEKNGYYSWTNLMKLDLGKCLRNELLFREEDVAANMCSLLIFTSGTVGLPKGVMVSHDAVLYVVQALNKSLTQLKPGKESCITYLPLSHIASQFFDIFLGMLNGAAVYFADRNAMKGTLCETIKEVRPTWFFGVPRIFEKLIERQAKTEEKLLEEVEKTLYNNARELVLKQYKDQMGGNMTATLAHGWAFDIVKEIKMGLGLDGLKYCFTGGASVSEELKMYFLSLNLPLTEAFGMSETCGGVTADFKRPNLQTSGQALAGVEFKIHNPDIFGEGEILIRGRCNFMGYLKEPQKTREAFTEDGYIKSGDSGQLDADGNVYINGRIKEIIITSGGENIPPVYIEDQIKKLLPCVGNAMVVGDNRKYLTVLLTFKTLINPDTGYPTNALLPETIQWLATLQVHCTKLNELFNTQLPENLQNLDFNNIEIKLDPRVLKGLQNGIDSYNQVALSNAQKIQYFRVLPHDFSVPTGELGPTLKSRRSFIHQKYAKIIDQMYN